MRLATEPVPRAMKLSGLVVAVALLVDALALRILLLERASAIARFDRLGVFFALVDVVGVVAASSYLRALVPAVRADASLSSDRRVLVLGSAALAIVYYGFHVVHGPLGAFLAGRDAYGLVDDVSRAFSTTVGAAIHALGLVAVALHAFEVLAANESSRRKVVVVAAAIAFVVTALDPIAAVTIGRPLLSRPSAGSLGMTSSRDSATLPPR